MRIRRSKVVLTCGCIKYVQTCLKEPFFNSEMVVVECDEEINHLGKGR